MFNQITDIVEENKSSNIFANILFNAVTNSLLNSVLTSVILVSVSRVGFKIAGLQGIAVGTSFFVEEIASNYDLPLIGKSPYLGAAIGGVVKHSIIPGPSAVITIGKELIYVGYRQQNFFENYPLLEFGAALIFPIAVETIGNNLALQPIMPKLPNIRSLSYELASAFGEITENVKQSKLHIPVEGTHHHKQLLKRTNEGLVQMANAATQDIFNVVNALAKQNLHFGKEELLPVKTNIYMLDKFASLLHNMQVQVNALSADVIANKVTSIKEDVLQSEVSRTAIRESAETLINMVVDTKTEITNIISTMLKSVTSVNIPTKIDYFYQTDIKQGLISALLDYIAAKLEVDPNKGLTNFLRGKELVYNHDYEAAITAFNNVIADDVSNSEAYALLGLLYTHLKYYDKAKDSFDEMIKLDDKNVQAHIYLSNVYALQGQDTQALQILDKALQMNPEYSIGQYDLATLAMVSNIVGGIIAASNPDMY